MTTLIQRLRLMSDDAGADEVQALLDSDANKHSFALAVAAENRKLRQALKRLANAARHNEDLDLALAEADSLLAQRNPPNVLPSFSLKP
jgi:hypothetical protein